MINRRNIKKVIIIFLLVLFTELYTCNTVLAKIPVDDFKIDTGKAGEFESIGNTILGTVQVIGTFAAVAALMIIGIRYMLGSAEEKSEKKQSLIYYIIGAILVLGIVNIVPVIYGIANNIN